MRTCAGLSAPARFAPSIVTSPRTIPRRASRTCSGSAEARADQPVIGAVRDRAVLGGERGEEHAFREHVRREELVERRATGLRDRCDEIRREEGFAENGAREHTCLGGCAPLGLNGVEVPDDEEDRRRRQRECNAGPDGEAEDEPGRVAVAVGTAERHHLRSRGRGAGRATSPSNPSTVSETSVVTGSSTSVTTCVVSSTTVWVVSDDSGDRFVERLLDGLRHDRGGRGVGIGLRHDVRNRLGNGPGTSFGVRSRFRPAGCGGARSSRLGRGEDGDGRLRFDGARLRLGPAIGRRQGGSPERAGGRWFARRSSSAARRRSLLRLAPATARTVVADGAASPPRSALGRGEDDRSSSVRSPPADPTASLPSAQGTRAAAIRSTAEGSGSESPVAARPGMSARTPTTRPRRATARSGGRGDHR